MRRLGLAKRCICGGFAEEARLHGIDDDGFICSKCGAYFQNEKTPKFTMEQSDPTIF